LPLMPDGSVYGVKCRRRPADRHRSLPHAWKLAELRQLREGPAGYVNLNKQIDDTPPTVR
jgi:hypothetical protein